MINADPDALAAALALSRLIRHRVHSVTIARINEITRPDNLAMIRYLRIPVVKWDSSLSYGFQRYALVDSQPHHHSAFGEVDFAVVIDHHNLPESQSQAAFSEIKPDYGTTSTILTEYLYNAGIRPDKRLATALQYGIRTDTNTFGRESTEVDLRAYHYLDKFANSQLLTRIMRSEYLPEWLPFFSRAFESLRRCGTGYHSLVGKVASGDLLVVVADFFLRVHGLRWVAVCGQVGEEGIVVFRGGGIGSVDLGKLAAEAFAEVGSAGGHKSMARAEFPMQVMQGEDLNSFTFKRIKAAVPNCGQIRRIKVLRAALTKLTDPKIHMARALADCPPNCPPDCPKIE